MKTSFFTKQQLTECIGLNTDTRWDEIYIELIRSESGVVRAYTRGERLPFYANGYGYDKHGVVLADFLNYWVGKKICINSGEGKQQVIDCAKEHGYLIESLCQTKSGQLYKFSIIKGVA
jgi:hypothetical protein